MKFSGPSGLTFTSPEFYALLDRSREGNPGIHRRTDYGQTPAQPKTAPTLQGGQSPHDLPDRDVTLRCGHIMLAPDHITTPNSLRGYRSWAKLNFDCKQCYFEDKQRERNSIPKSLGLPNLGGTEKQIKWALSIRNKYLTAASMVRYGHSQLFHDSMAWFKSDYRARDAVFFICHRTLNLEELMALVSGTER